MKSVRRRKAFSYLRFSSPEQAKGDSFRRQTALAVQYAKTNNLDLDESLTFYDLGVSAYRGLNSETGQLGALLEAVKCGLIPKNSVILVESLDRISRQAARKALRVIENIVEFGVAVVTLNDGREYTSESLDNDPINLLMALLTFIRANEESTIKSQRLAAMWVEKRRLARERPITAKCPAWLSLSQDRQSFDLKTDYVQIVQGIFRAALDGQSVISIARNLNAQGVPTLRHGGRKAKYWQTPGLSMLLKSPTVIGTLTPRTMTHVGGRAIIEKLEPIENYYPAVISCEDFTRVQELRNADRNFIKGVYPNIPLRNILARLGRCVHCESPMILSSRTGNIRYLVCKKAFLRAGCDNRTVRYHEIETTIVKCLSSQIQHAYPMKTIIIQRRVDYLKLLLNSPVLDRTLANAALKTLLDSVLFDTQELKLGFNWKHGRTTSIENAFERVKSDGYPRIRSVRKELTN